MAKAPRGYDLVYSLVTERVVPSPVYPRYVSQLINLANQNAGATRPEYVGQISDLVQECPDTSVEGWTQWYLERYPNAVDEAVPKIRAMLENLSEALVGERRPLAFGDSLIREWVEDLIFTKSVEGIMIQHAILAEFGRREGVPWRTATADEESEGIDGWVGDEALSIKPESYLAKRSTVREVIPVETVYYRKTDRFIRVFRPTRQLEIALF